MKQGFTKKALVRLASQVKNGERIDAEMVDPFLSHRFQKTSGFARFMLRIAAWMSLFFASVLVIFPEVGEYLIAVLPDFFLLPERLAKALDYVWGLVGEPVKKQHLMYHLPNIIIYAFGVAGIRQLWRRINRNNWKDLVADAQKALSESVAQGSARLRFTPGFSMLFVGDGDRTACNLVVDNPTIGPTIATKRPAYTSLWSHFDPAEGDEGFARVLERINADEAGEYQLFPVVDEHLFLPGPHEYDTPPHRVEIAVRRIRELEKDMGWTNRRILIVGDNEQASRFVTSSDTGRVESPYDEVSLRTISEEYPGVTVVDPTDLTLRRIVEIADGRRVLFRASDQGAEKYAAAFYRRLGLLGYKPTRDDFLTIGYDISDLETEHQVVARRQSEYLPVILSRDVFDLLSKSYLRDGTYIFVPHLVNDELERLVA